SRHRPKSRGLAFCCRAECEADRPAPELQRGRVPTATLVFLKERPACRPVPSRWSCGNLQADAAQDAQTGSLTGVCTDERHSAPWYGGEDDHEPTQTEFHTHLGGLSRPQIRGGGSLSPFADPISGQRRHYSPHYKWVSLFEGGTNQSTRKFAPRCCVCSEPIMPAPGQEETVRIVALDRDFHVQCYRCEDCGSLLSEGDNQGCYPLDGHVLCKNCNSSRIQDLTAKATTDL
ncbi:hypothetical protein KUCAC02_022432, partial [Chaenocephalus aceratus]